MPKLTDAQLVILSAAAQREGGAVLPAPKSLKVQGGALNSILKDLLKKKLVAEQHAARGAAVWRAAEDGQRMTLVITDAGLKAINVDPAGRSVGQAASGKRAPKKPKERNSRSKSGRQAKTNDEGKGVRPGTKLALVIDLLNRQNGATIEEMVKATKWQPHSVRGAISDALKKKLCLAVTSEKVKGRGRFYRMAAWR